MCSKYIRTSIIAIVISALCQSAWGTPVSFDELEPFGFDEQEETFPDFRNHSQRATKDLGYFFTSDNYDMDEEKIAGGSYANEGQFPFMAVVHRLMGDGMISQCGGTIISKRWVLTAGHCIHPSPRKFLVVFGVINKSGIGYDSYKGPGVAMRTDSGAVHPEYKQIKNDIALLHMPEDIPFSDTIQPISIAGPSYSDESFASKTAYIIGWGKDRQTGSGVKNLKYATIPIISNSECNRYWGVNNENICIAPGAGTTTCQGDSGGPLTVTENGKQLQVGVVSYGDGRCPSSKPAVFTRVSTYSRWIQAVTGLQL